MIRLVATSRAAISVVVRCACSRRFAGGQGRAAAAASAGSDPGPGPGIPHRCGSDHHRVLGRVQVTILLNISTRSPRDSSLRWPHPKRTTTIVSFVSRGELDALLGAPDRATWHGRRDVPSWCSQPRQGCASPDSPAQRVRRPPGCPYVYCSGKGRKVRATPLTPHTIGVLTT